MTVAVDIQWAVTAGDELWLPPAADIRRWVRAVWRRQRPGRAQLTVRVVDRDEAAVLNETYRHRQGPTNVLSFPVHEPGLVDPPLLGDIVICAPLVAAEAREQDKEIAAHWAHLVVHGVLHLLDYDHETDASAEAMEAIEIMVLGELGWADPYAENPALQPRQPRA